MTPIVIKDLGINEELGLRQELRVWRVNCNAEDETVIVYYKVYTISPTGADVAVSEELNYVRYNNPTNMAFNTWRNSPIGQGITYAINGTLNNYPNLDQVNP